MREVGFDTETRGLRWFLPEEQAFLGTWADTVGEYAEPGVAGPPAGFLDALRGADVLVAHNAKFDGHQVRATWGVDVFALPVELHDTDLMSRILFPEGQRKDRGGHGLKNLAEVYLRADAKDAEEAIKQAAKDIGLRSLKRPGAYFDVWRAYPELMERYAVLDARYTLDLYRKFKDRGDAKLKALYELERRTQRVLYKAETLGTRVDPEAVERLRVEHAGTERDARGRLERELGFVPEGEGSDAALAEALQGAGVELTETTPTGEIAVNRDALRPFEDHPAVAALFDWRRARKFLSTYIEPLVDREYVHPDFNQAEAWTGRMSCRRPNMQNLPKRTDVGLEDNMKLRSMFVPRPGMKFVVADYEGVETRILAYYLGVPWYRDLVDQGDPHAWTAAAIWGGKPEDYAKGGPKGWMRDVAKHSTFAITYGAGAPKVRDTINKMVSAEHRIDVDWVKNPNIKYDAPPEARRIKNTIVSSIPGYQALAGRRGRIAQKIEAQGYVRTKFGRMQFVAPDKTYVGLNALIQGTAADVMKQAAVNLEEALRPEGGYPLLFVHDEALVEVPAELPDERAKLLVVEAMEAAGEDITPRLRVEAKVTRESYAHG